MTCSRMLNMSGCAFSISSSSSTQCGCLVDAIGQQAALVETDIARRRADQPRLTVWRSMYSDMSKRSSSTPSDVGQLLRHFGLADAGGAREQVGADRLLRLAQARPGQLDRGGERA